MPTIQVNERTVEARAGEMLLDTLRRAGIRVPTLCAMSSLFPSGACRLCVVDVEGQRGLVPSCAFPVQEGMRVRTHSARAVEARRTIVELLLADHPDDCLYCPRNGTCDLQALAAELGVRERRFTGARRESHLDASSPSLVRDPSKCILCGRCVRVCHEIQEIGAIDFVGRGCATRVGTALDRGLNVSSCVNCGQCIMVCPTGALTEHDQTRAVLAALTDPDRIPVVQHAPSISVTLGEALGARPGADLWGPLNAGLRRLGFRRVFDTSFAADLTIMEEASELVHRIRTGAGPLPMMTSCSPAWIKTVEQEWPDFLPHLSTCKSPQQMMGALVKGLWAPREGVDPRRVFSVAIMPCTAKKFEAGRPEMGHDGLPDVDAVLTTRELAALFRMRGMDVTALGPDAPDNPFGERSTAGKLFGATGGVMEAALRTAAFLLTGEELPHRRLQPLRGMAPRKEARVKVGDLELGVAVVNGLGAARALVEEIRAGRDDLHFVEVMSCPGGCIAGGGQPLGTDPAAVRARMQTLYRIDRDEHLRTSHRNPWVQRLYAEFLGEPLGERSHHLLHTRYTSRDVL